MESPAVLTSLDGTGTRPWVPAWWSWPIVAAVVAALAIGGVGFSAPGSGIAVWWPAAGVSVWFVLINPPRRRPGALALIAVMTALANIVSGRDVAVALGFGVANAAEALVVTTLLSLGAARFVLGRTLDALRFLLAVTAGALTAGVLAGATVTLFEGREFATIAASAALSHAAAVLLIAPFAVLPPRIHDAFSWIEVIVQSALVAAAVALVFRPGSDLPLAFLPLTLVTWAAFRFPMVMALAQSLAVGVAALILTLVGGGPFAARTAEPVPLVNVFLIGLGVITVLLVSARQELRRATRAAARTAQLVSGGFVDSAVGLVVAEDDGDASTVIWANGSGRALLDAELDETARWSGPLETNVRAALALGTEIVCEHGGRTIRLAANRIPGEDARYAVQLIDVSSTVRMTQARLDAESERDAARTARRDLERQREDFVATTSHELRTPVTSILGYAELLADSDALAAQEKEWVGIIARNGVRLASLVEDLLTLGRARNAPVDATTAVTLDAHELIRDVVLTQQPAADAKALAVLVETGDDATVHAVAGDTVRALGNLVSNALKFTPPSGIIRIRAARDRDETVITVSDSGPGMSAGALAHAFDRFYRAPEAERASTPGAGLGLSIARELAERNGGTIGLESAPGSGVTATLRLPRSA